ncbi:glycoside hydrolase family 127 protein [Saccharibacillus sp. CPCC 101409]|uniref:beta-L-arabinofuranosidase domain-containing protein n=1 Tax=Saccharibacillus sp. CPCC 101409 TaxID=3058041 RepID=UPI0026729490|nr:beta-L-arabinofuranosidase domain-containing protein [Saccharibacillus sp. CPCC 101409]MDO3409103.1 glycoside hydrolase family 127 protein [Saccharibacillus sp. CPCC 101409]
MPIEYSAPPLALTGFRPDRVRIADAYLNNAFDREIRYLKNYEPDRLLAGFRETRGLEPLAAKYPGWESTEIRGHTLGHYLKALAQAYAASGDADLKIRLEQLAAGLTECQFDSGYLSAFPEELFDRVERKQPAWVPWYTMHKIVAGLTAAYEAAGSRAALDIAARLGGWIARRTEAWTPEIQAAVLAVEYGGMNDCLYDLYKLTGERAHLDAAHRFDELTLLGPVREGRDILTGKHANTTIPKFIGALNRYRTLGESERFYLEAAQRFWDMVAGHHSYITGGNSEWEHFGEPDKLDRERSNFTAETCNTYNMLKLTRELFMLSGEAKYADFYENTFLNAIVSSQHPHTGMTMYFQPMATGYFKVYSSPFEHFWCCTGTGMESFTKLNDSLYFQDGDGILVHQYISSELDAEDEFGLRLTQRSALPERETAGFVVSLARPQTAPVSLRFRLPDWLAGEAELTLNGERAPLRAQGGFAAIRRVWADGDEVELRLPMTLRAIELPDAPHAVAFKYGPVVLSAGLGREDMAESATGVAVSVPTRSMLVKDFITVSGHPGEWLDSFESRWKRRGEALEFALRGTDEDERLVFTPHYKRHGERYGIYWRIVQADSPELQRHILDAKRRGRVDDATVDSLPVGNDQYELEHAIRGERTFVDVWDGSTTRRAESGGWFGYTLRVRPRREHVLEATFFSGHRGDRPIAIEAGGAIVADGIPPSAASRGFHTHRYTLPAELIGEREQIDVAFRVNGQETGIFEVLRMMRPFGADPSLRLLEFSAGSLDLPFDPAMARCTLRVPADTAEISFRAAPAGKYGLVYADGVLIEDTLPRSVRLEGERTVFRLGTKAEDHETSLEYEIEILRG